MPAAFWAQLVLDLHGARAGALQRADRVAHVQRVAEAGVGVDHDRQLHRIADRRRVLGDLRQADEAEVGQAEKRVRQPRAGQIDGLEAELLDDARRQRIGCAGHEQRIAPLEPLAEFPVDLDAHGRVP